MPSATGIGGPPACPVVVPQAVGMTMEYLDCSGLEALAMLTVLAVAKGMTLLDLAGVVVERPLR